MGDWAIVYRGFAVPALDMVEAMLHAEGLQPRRLGKASPALLGLGDWAVEQLIEVPREHEQAARELIAGSGQAAGPSDELEAQALSVPVESSAPELPGLDPRVIVLLVVVAVVVFFWLSAS